LHPEAAGSVDLAHASSRAHVWPAGSQMVGQEGASSTTVITTSDCVVGQLM
jgi:hypothetical protein